VRNVIIQKGKKEREQHPENKNSKKRNQYDGREPAGKKGKQREWIDSKDSKHQKEMTKRGERGWERGIESHRRDDLIGWM